MEKFVDEEMGAPNVIRVPIDLGTTAEAEWLRRLTSSKAARSGLYSQAPPWRSDIRWYSARNRRDFRRFRSIFHDLGIARHVERYLDLEKEVRLYNSFLVVRTSCDEPDFHVDWADANNEGFTLMTPLTSNCGGFGMLYKKLDGDIAEYDYKPGEALIFGDDFLHSTKPGSSDEPVVLLCFNFGTDKIEHWPRLERTASRQSILFCRPDGRFERRAIIKRIRNMLGILRRKAGLSRTPASPVGY